MCNKKVYEEVDGEVNVGVNRRWSFVAYRRLGIASDLLDNGGRGMYKQLLKIGGSEKRITW